jgi:citrate lyase subunit beta/citryl-CoA lyase
LLFVPGGDQRKIDKIPTLRGTGFILDLEDSVAPAGKPRARSQVAAAIAAHRESAPLYVRVNSVSSEWLCDDLDAVVMPGLTGIALPKVNEAHDVRIADWYLGVLERRRGLEPDTVGLLVTIETLAGLAHVDAIASASRRTCALCFGAGDFSLELGLDWPAADGQLSHTVLSAKAAIVVAARRHGLEPHDGAFPDFRDTAGLRAEAAQARALGFSAKRAIHPAQLPILAEVFMPTERELARAREIVTTFDRSVSEGSAAVQLDGRMIDTPVAARARRLLDAAGEQATPR